MKRRNNIEQTKQRYPEGTRIQLFKMRGVDLNDCGTVVQVDDIGQIHVRWDSGTLLALNPEKDVFRKME